MPAGCCICPVRKVVVDVNIRDGKVYLRKRCPEHGGFEALVYGDAEAYTASARFNKPGTIPLEQCERMLDTFVASEGDPEVVMLSGGEHARAPGTPERSFPHHRGSHGRG